MTIEKLESYVQKNTAEQILTNALNCFFGTVGQDSAELRMKFNKETFKEITKDISYFEENIEDLKMNWKEYKWLYDVLNDEKSRETLLGMIEAKLTMNANCIEQVFSKDVMYFDEKIFGHFENEVYIDCGAYTGDSVIKFIQICPQYQKIYAFEAVPQIAEKCKENLRYFEEKGKVKILEYAIFDSEKEIFFNVETLSGDSKESSNGNLKVKAIALDDVIKDNVTFIKMDIEGSEKSALEGAKKLINMYTPKMAICIYHLKDDFWKIPQQILAINPDYIFQIRQHDLEVYSETVLYCIPKQKQHLQNIQNLKDIAANLKEAEKQLVFYTEQENVNLLQHVKDKKWYLQQLRNYKDDNEKKANDNENFVKYNKELLESKSWLEGQVENYQKSTKEKDQMIFELQNWAKELEDGKIYLEEQWNKEKNEKQEMAAHCSEMEGQFNEINNIILKQKYKLNVLLNDVGVQKIIKKKKYDV